MKLHRPLPLGHMLTQRFGNPDSFYIRLGMKGHNGHDWGCPVGTPLYAAHDGIVTFANIDNAGGYGVTISSTDKYQLGKGILSRIKTVYWHIKEGGFVAKLGDTVKAGDLIAYSGNTGLSTGPHLHFALKLINDNGDTINNDNGFLGAIDHVEFYDYGDILPITSMLKVGSRGNDVLNFQKLCAWFGFYDPADFYPRFGQRTKDALGRFQVFVMGKEIVGQNYINNDVANDKPVFGKKTLAFVKRLLN